MVSDDDSGSGKVLRKIQRYEVQRKALHFFQLVVYTFSSSNHPVIKQYEKIIFNLLFGSKFKQILLSGEWVFCLPLDSGKRLKERSFSSNHKPAVISYCVSGEYLHVCTFLSKISTTTLHFPMKTTQSLLNESWSTLRHHVRKKKTKSKCNAAV